MQASHHVTVARAHTAPLQLDNQRGPYNVKEKALGNVLIHVGGRGRGRSMHACLHQGCWAAVNRILMLLTAWFRLCSLLRCHQSLQVCGLGDDTVEANKIRHCEAEKWCSVLDKQGCRVQRQQRAKAARGGALTDCSCTELWFSTKHAATSLVPWLCRDQARQEGGGQLCARAAGGGWAGEEGPDAAEHLHQAHGCGSISCRMQCLLSLMDVPAPCPLPTAHFSALLGPCRTCSACTACRMRAARRS